MRVLAIVALLMSGAPAFAQEVGERLAAAVTSLKKDEQFAHASVSLYVVNSKSGAVVFDRESQLGLQPASTQKVITSISAFDLLGQPFTFKTRLAYDGDLQGTVLKGNIYFIGGGDPTAGSWRWKTTSPEAYLQKIGKLLRDKKITAFEGQLISDTRQWESQATPRGWIWEDVGNYYGAGLWGLNWNENQFDLNLVPGNKAGEKVVISGTTPAIGSIRWINELTTGKEGSGDNSIIYLGENSGIAVARGTVPAGKATFSVKGAVPDGKMFFLSAVKDYLLKNQVINTRQQPLIADAGPAVTISSRTNVLGTLESPSMDSMTYWFLQKSINLYGEAFVKAIAFEKKGFGATDSGLAIIRHFWSVRGIERSALKMLDGSGLSPANRVTTHALVTAMQHASRQPWFSSFYTALPLLNGIRMKDGYISGVRAYTGYIKSKTGVEYTFAFIGK